MFDLEKAIVQWRRQMTDDGINSPDVLDELESHLRERAERLKSGMNAQEAFQNAARELGESKLLKREFARAGRLSLWNWRENPISLNLAAACFVWMGLNALSQLVGIVLLPWPWKPVYALSLVGAVCLVFALQIVAGLGIVRRINVWRKWALGFAAFDTLSAIFALVAWFRFTGAVVNGSYYIYMGAPMPEHFRWITESFGLAMSVWSIYVLTRPTIRELFRSKSVEEMA